MIRIAKTAKILVLMFFFLRRGRSWRKKAIRELMLGTASCVCGEKQKSRDDDLAMDFTRPRTRSSFLGSGWRTLVAGRRDGRIGGGWDLARLGLLLFLRWPGRGCRELDERGGVEFKRWLGTSPSPRTRTRGRDPEADQREITLG